MLSGPIPATEMLLAKSGKTIEDFDVYEVNEAFAPVPLGWAKAMGADVSKVRKTPSWPRSGANFSLL